MKKLYEVERKFYVMAEDELEAEDFDPHDTSGCTNDAFLASGVEAEWWNCLPYNGDDDKTCGQIITELRLVDSK